MGIWMGEKVKLRAFEESDGEYNFSSWNDSETGPIATDFHFIIENLDGETVGDIGTGECDSKFGTYHWSKQ